MTKRSTLIESCAGDAYRIFIDADALERHQLCDNLEGMAEYDGTDLVSALKLAHPELLVRILHHWESQGRREPEPLLSF